MTPEIRYQQALSQEGFSRDPAQAQAVEHLQSLFKQLVSPQSAGLKRWLNALTKKDKTPLKGLYLWGGVGRGKTWLMDSFYQCLPFEDKVRIHFHHFMRRIHKELKSLEGEKNPLQMVAQRLAKETRIICFDEFFVSDITDAMILGGLFEQLFQRGVILVATSNVEPDHLYENGLQRARFLPAIALLKQHTKAINLDGGIDYRLRLLEKANIWHSPVTKQTRQHLSDFFVQLVVDKAMIKEGQSLAINDRTIESVKVGEDSGWFTFSALCDGPRSQNDYIELASEFQTIILSEVPVLSSDQDNQARRFINLVDEFYDRNVKLIVSSDVQPEMIYTGNNLVFEFQRTISRLQEMQSKEYLARPHKP